ncbi:MAG: copper amine oxidase N-terminal domain-containing protein [Firmicutes bacterium]|nr:copper amine oxidase N-terminal domain-containing protein [Bacillota bacterium]
MKKYICAFLGTALLTASVFSAVNFKAVECEGATPITLTVNNVEIKGAQQPTIINDITYVPLRLLFDNLGAQFTWDAENKSVHATKGGKSIKMWVGKNYSIVNGKEKENENVPVILDGYTYIPARYVTDAFGLEIQWDGQKRIVNIKDPTSKIQTSTTTTEKTTETTTQTTTEVTTKNPGDSVIPGVSRKLYTAVVQDFKQTADSYRLGGAETNPRFKTGTVNKLFAQWKRFVNTKEEESFEKAAESAYNSLLSSYKSFDNTYNNNVQYKGAGDCIRRYLEKAQKVISTFGQIEKTSDMSKKLGEFRSAYSGMSKELEQIRFEAKNK